MKLSKLFLMGAIALGIGLTACNKEEVGIDPNAPEATVSVKIMRDANPGTKVIGDLTDPGVNPDGVAAESAIKKVQVWVFAGNALNGYKESTTAEVKDIATSVGSRDIYVVVNGKGLGSGISKANLEAATENVPVDIEDGLTMTAEKFTVSIKEGKNTIGYGEVAEANNLGSEPVKVTRINARVAIATAALEVEDDALLDELKDVQVAMFNVQKTAKIFAPSETSGDWLYGAEWPSPETSYHAGVVTPSFLEGEVEFPIKITDAPYFYVNPMATAGEMFIVLRGKPFKGGVAVEGEGLYVDEDGYTYYPVWINQDGEISTENEAVIEDGKVYRNTQYNIYLTIKKIGNPTIDKPQEGTLDVKVVVEPWKVVTQNVVW